MSYCVYKHTFPNDKVYIGITSQNPEDRWKNGFGYLGMQDGKYKQPLIARAIQKYGWDNIEHEILFEGLTKEEASQKEIELISAYKSANPEYGYNSALGGTNGKHSEETKRKLSEIHKGVSAGEKNYFYGKHFFGTDSPCARKVAQYDLKMNLIKIWDYIKQASDELNIDNSGITACCKKRQKTAFGYIWRYVDDYNNIDKIINDNDDYTYNKGKQIRCVETNINYCSIASASKHTNIDKHSIGDCCRGKQKTAGGFHWEFVDEDAKNKASEFARNKTNKRKRQVKCIETKKVYESISCASKETDISASSICSVCSDKKKTAGGYHWEYVDEEKYKKHTVRCIETGVVYKSATQAQKETGVHQASISKVCRGEGNTAGGYHWEYVEEPTQ